MVEAILEVKELKKHFPVRTGFFSRPTAWIKAADGVNFDAKKGEILGIVGESGCGKTTLVHTILRLEEPTSGKVIFDGRDIFSLNRKDMRKIRSNLQIVFQDPFWSLNPRMLIKDIIGEPIKVHQKLKRGKMIERVEELLEMVGIASEGVYKYPHEFSGGQRQRIAIARALSLSPKLVVLDEPTSAIDVLSQMQILLLLKNLKEKLGLTYILISHDLGVINYMADKIAVMYLGKVVEYGPTEDIFKNPAHPYTNALLEAIPDLSTVGLDNVFALEGDVPSPINPPSGCSFHTRCPVAKDICKIKVPKSVKIGKAHYATCLLLE